MKNSILAITFILLSTACVSVQIPTSSGKKSKQVTLSAPVKPFIETENKTMDAVWINESNGNTISYISECNAKIEPTLEQLESDTILSLSTVTSKTSEKKSYNFRQALYSDIVGTLDGVEMKIRQISLLKNNCSFTISYTGLESKFDENLTVFETFLKDFKIQ
jgi:hypothetical protein